jgi:hypothetical protein
MFVRIVLMLVLFVPARAVLSLDLQAATAGSDAEEFAIRKVIADYAKAIENKDLALFKNVKPNLTSEEEKRARSAFASIQSQVVKITFLSIDVKERQAIVKVTRRDTINGTIPGAFPQTFNMSKGRTGWVIDEIGR